jgi:hypothetical protein
MGRFSIAQGSESEKESSVWLAGYGYPLPLGRALQTKQLLKDIRCGTAI